MTNPDFEALVTSKIQDALLAAIEKVGRPDFEKVSGVESDQLSAILSHELEYIPVALVTIACQINKAHNDANLSHSSVTECLKGSTIRMPAGQNQPRPLASSDQKRRRLPNLYRDVRVSRTEGGKSFRVLGFSVNTLTFLLLGYFLGGVLVSPLLGQPSCLGLTTNPLSLAPCAGSVAGIILGAIGGLGYTYYYFVKKL